MYRVLACVSRNNCLLILSSGTSGMSNDVLSLNYGKLEIGGYEFFCWYTFLTFMCLCTIFLYLMYQGKFKLIIMCQAEQKDSIIFFLLESLVYLKMLPNSI
jgi:hypothetical protein